MNLTISRVTKSDIGTKFLSDKVKNKIKKRKNKHPVPILNKYIIPKSIILNTIGINFQIN